MMELTVRDKKIIAFLAEKGVVTSKQLITEFFPSVDTYRKRIRLLRQMRIVEPLASDEMNEIAQSNKISDAEVLLVARGEWPGNKPKLFRLGNGLISVLNGEIKSRTPQYWAHQLRLNAIRAYLLTIYPSGSFLTESEILAIHQKIGSGYETVVPDLVMRVGKIEFAFKLEQNILDSISYFNKSVECGVFHYKRFIYFCDSLHTYNFLINESSKFEKFGVSLLNNPEIVFYPPKGFVFTPDFLNCYFFGFE